MGCGQPQGRALSGDFVNQIKLGKRQHRLKATSYLKPTSDSLLGMGKCKVKLEVATARVKDRALWHRPFWGAIVQ